MNIAFGLHGIVGGIDGKYGAGDSKEALEKGYEHYKKYILDHNDCDVFCHTSTMERKSEILDLYKPVKSKFTEQPNFEIPSGHHAGKRGTRIQGHYHKWWSHKIVSELRQEYEKETGVKYDMVYIGRYDLAWTTPVDFSKFDTNKFWLGHWNRLKGISNLDWYKKRLKENLPLIKNNKYNNDDIPLVGYPHNHEGVIDQWAFSNPKFMDSYCALWDFIDEYITRKPNTWWGGKSTIHDASGQISNHRLIPCHLENIGLLDKLDFAFYLHDDFPTVRRMYYAR
jgi:hypothetical protein|tara:strand:+ start:1547 stop:2392 length:846 start_codon:yes stop_codon:yes gene_type:complete